ncbi:MAG: S8 family serine peptidase, partial [Clostridiales bacterium]|nr:S8 family serine peptidase [Clostridiales bacterium]
MHTKRPLSKSAAVMLAAVIGILTFALFPYVASFRDSYSGASANSSASAAEKILDYAERLNALVTEYNGGSVSGFYKPDVEIKKSETTEESGGAHYISAAFFAEKTESGGVSLELKNDGAYAEFKAGGFYTELISSNSHAYFNGSLTVLKGGAPRFLNGELIVPLADTAEALGYSVTEKDDSFLLSRDFQTMRLLVEAFDGADLGYAAARADGYKNYGITNYALQYASEYDAKQAYDRLSADPKIVSVTPDTIVTLSDVESADGEAESGGESVFEPQVSSDPSAYAYKTWGAAATQMDFFNYNRYLYATYAQLPQITVAVIDTGLDYNNAFFSGRIAGGKSFVNNVPSDDYMDANGHGTHVAGTVVDLTLPNVKIYSVKVLGDDGTGLASWGQTGYDYVTSIAATHNIKVINMSLSSKNRESASSKPYNARIENALAQKGVVTVVAAGNANDDTEYYSPAKVPAAVTVAAVNSSKSRASFSNYGDEVDVAAPGVSIYSAYLNNAWQSLNGTSMASPHVAALFAAVFGDTDRGYTAQTLIAAVTDNARDLGAEGFDVNYGWGFAVAPTLWDSGDGPEPPPVDPPEPVDTVTVTTNTPHYTTGTLSPTGTLTVARGSDLTFTFEPNDGYYLFSFKVNDSAVPKDALLNNSYTLTNIQADTMVNVSFSSIQTYNYSTESLGNGSVSPLSGSVGISPMLADYVTFIFTPDTGYELSVVLINGAPIPITDVVNNTYTMSRNGYNPSGVSVQGYFTKERTTISAAFSPMTFTVDASVSSGGAVLLSAFYDDTEDNNSGVPRSGMTGGSSITVNYGGGVTAEFMPDGGYYLSGVSVNGKIVPLENIVDNKYTILNVAEDIEVVAEFAVLTYRVTVSVNGGGGSASLSETGGL